MRPTCPDWLDVEAWNAFCEMRGLMGRSIPFTDHAAKLILRRLEDYHRQGYDATSILENSIEKGYRGVFLTQDTPRRALNGKEQGNVRQINSMASSAFKAMK
jgi:hypothetical protein